MARTKPYTLKLAILDFLLLLFTLGVWSLVMIPRELYRWK